MTALELNCKHLGETYKIRFQITPKVDKVVDGVKNPILCTLYVMKEEVRFPKWTEEGISDDGVSSLHILLDCSDLTSNRFFRVSADRFGYRRKTKKNKSTTVASSTASVDDSDDSPTAGLGEPMTLSDASLEK